MKYAVWMLIFFMGCNRSAGIGSDTESDTANITDTHADTHTGLDTHSDSGTVGAIESETLADSDTVTDSDTATDTDTATDSDTESAFDTETAIDSRVTACVDYFDMGCDCYGDCVDGTGYVMVYRKDNLPTDLGFWSPSAEEVEKALFWYRCAGCTPCGEQFSIKNSEGEWEGLSRLEFCTAMVDYDDACEGCLSIDAY